MPNPDPSDAFRHAPPCPRRARPEEASEIADLMAQSFAALSSEQWTAKSLCQGLREGTLMASMQVRPDGLSGIAGYALGRVLDRELAELLSIAVVPELRRRGVGRALLIDLVGHLAATGAERLLAEVRADDQGARSFYGALGFADDGRRPHYYRNTDGTRSDAMLISLSLSNIAPLLRDA